MILAAPAAVLTFVLASASPASATDLFIVANSDGTCPGAHEIDATGEGVFTVSGDTSDAGVGFAPYPKCNGPGGTPGLDTTLPSNWYKFNLNSMSDKSRLTVDSCNATMYDLDFAFFTGSDCDTIECLESGPRETAYCWGEDYQLRSGKSILETEESQVYLMVHPGSYPDSQNGPYNLTVTVEHVEIPESPTTSPTNPPTKSDCSDIPECGFTATGLPKVPMCWQTNSGSGRTKCKPLSKVSDSRFLGCGCCVDFEPWPPSYCQYRNN